jgi:hypothetical protein
MNVGLGLDHAQAETTALRGQIDNAIDQPHTLAGQAQGFGQEYALKLLPKTSVGVTMSESLNLLVVVATLIYVKYGLKGPVVGAMALLKIRFGQDDATGAADLHFGKKSGTTIGHGYQVLLSDKAFKSEKEEIGLLMPNKLIDMDIIANGFARLGQPPVETNLGIQQTVCPPALYLVIDSQVGTQKQVCLPGLNRDAHRRTIPVKIPGIWTHIMLGDDATGA